jgi:hypothetical protein
VNALLFLFAHVLGWEVDRLGAIRARRHNANRATAAQA